jgi:methionyl-tRNA synthetase
MKNKFYITNSIVYANGYPHIGYAFELIEADVLARYHRLQGKDVRFLTGTDEHGSSVAKAAAKKGIEPKELVDDVAARVQELGKVLNVSNNDFIRTTDRTRHWPAVEKMWRTLVANDDLYKKNYEGLYCVGHEAFIKKSDLVDGVCPLHKTEPEVIKEENWFFRLTKYKAQIKEKIESGELEILPHTKKKELLNLLEDAEDVSFSRPSSTLTWGIPVPDDPTQTIYVWADALTNYISALGYADNSEDFKKYWPADVHLVGKDILRFHAMIWPAMLLSANLPLPKAIYVHGFINVDGEKMSKTVGNVIDPFHVVEKYGADVVRYFLLREIPSDQDGDFSEKNLVERYNGDLANGLGNLVARVSTLIENNMPDGLTFDSKQFDPEVLKAIEDTRIPFTTGLDNFKLHESLAAIWQLITYADRYVNDTKPWALAKEDKEKFETVMVNLVKMILHITFALASFMPETADKIFEVFDFKKEEAGLEGRLLNVRKGGVLFPRVEV